MELLTFTEAAAFAGVSSKTIHKHVKQGKLVYVDTPLGKRIHKDQLHPYRDLLGASGNVRESPGSPEENQKLPLGNMQEQVGAPHAEELLPEDTVREQERSGVSTVPLQAHLSALELARSQLERTQVWLDEERERVQLAQQFVLQAERSKVALEAQLKQYQRVLSEQAESLAEERALRLTLQSRNSEPTGGELRQKNDLWESEKAELLQSVEFHKQRVEWLETRVPRWVRGLFGAK